MPTKEEMSDNKQKGETYLPPPDFATFLLSIASSAHMHLGILPSPSTNKTEVNLPLAKHTIDIIEMIEKKTKGNLEENEKAILDHVLYELRMIYVEKISPVKKE